MAGNMNHELPIRGDIPAVAVQVQKIGGKPFGTGRSIGLVTGMASVDGGIDVQAIVAAQSDHKYHDMLAQAFDGGCRKNRVNGVFTFVLPHGERAIIRAARKCHRPPYGEAICNYQDITDSGDRIALLAGAAALALVMLTPERYLDEGDHMIGACSIDAVLRGRSSAVISSSLPGMLC